jgi:hypothetical protein
MLAILLFFFPMRLARLAFLVRILVCNLLILGSYHDIETAPELEFLRIGGLLLYQIGFIVLPRIRDTGMSPYWLIAAFIPGLSYVLNFALLFRRSDYQQNPLLQRLEAAGEPPSLPVA